MKRKKKKQHNESSDTPRVSEVCSPYDIRITVDMELQAGLDRLMRSGVAIAQYDFSPIVSPLRQRIEAFHPDIAAHFTEEVLLRRIETINEAYSLLVVMMASARARGESHDAGMATMVSEFWRAEGDARKETAPQFNLQDWHTAVLESIECMIRGAALSYTKANKRITAVELDLMLSDYLRRVVSHCGIIDRFDPNFVGAVAAAAVNIVHELPAASKKKMKKFKGSGDVEKPEVIYRIPQNYWSWNVLKKFAPTPEALAINDADSYLRRSAAEACENFYLLGEQFLLELADTDMMIDDLRVMEEAPLPHPAFMWLLPRGYMFPSLPGEDAREVGAMMIVQAPETSAAGIAVALIHHAQGDYKSMWFEYFFDERGVLICDDNDVLGKSILQLILKVLASMVAEPKIIEYEAVTNLVRAKKKKRSREFRIPRTIGWKVRYVRVGEGHRRHGERSQVSAHWRRRHIRRVPYGPRDVPLHERPRRIVVVARTRVNSEYEEQ